MTRLLGRFSDYTYALLRMVAGFLFACHGAQKLFGVLGREDAVELMSRLGLAGIIEVVGGSVIALGLFTSYAAFIASGEMALAYFLVHWPQGFWPLVNRGEPAVLFCVIFLFITSRGSGPWSLDRFIRGTR